MAASGGFRAQAMRRGHCALLGVGCLGALACGSSRAAGTDAGSGDAGTPDAAALSSDSAIESGADVPPEVAPSPSLDIGVVVGALDAGPDVGLPPLPALTNVRALERDDSVGIDFDPVDDAVDYRVYALPDPSSVTVNGDGSIRIVGGVYRCAGLRQAVDLPNNVGNSLKAPDAGQYYADLSLSWTATVPASPMLGYVYVEPTPGAAPVYAVGLHPSQVEIGWRESRLKVYTTDARERVTLLAQGGRDDGIVFYAPSTASSETTTVYRSETVTPVPQQNWTATTDYYFLASDLAAHPADTTPPSAAFQVLTTAASGTAPLMAVLYQPGNNHTELAVGNERFKRAVAQGPGPLWHLEWSGLTGPTTLVIEALASGCPYQGLLSPKPLDAPPHQPFLTIEQMAQASPTGEVYINGQYNLALLDGGSPALARGSTSPVPIARSYVAVVPQPHDPSAWDWYEGFSPQGAAPAFTPVADMASCSCDTPSASVPCQAKDQSYCGYWTSSAVNAGAYEVDAPGGVPVASFGLLLGQFWEAFDDWDQSVAGSLRFTAPQMATIDADPTSFLHVTWSVDTVVTSQRYPQLVVSDQLSPVEDGFLDPNANFVLVQPIGGSNSSMRLEVEAFHGLFDARPWSVNNQAPAHVLIDYDAWDTDFPSVPPLPPFEPPFEHSGMDRMTRYDAFLSSNRIYVFMDGTPAGCTQYPGGAFALRGSVSVTFGDVVYDESSPTELICYRSRPFVFLHEHQCSETKRHWDDLAFKSGVPAPPWNETLYPCMTY